MINRVVFLLSIIGLLISGYLLNRYVTGGPIVCGKTAGCEIVRASSFAYFFGLPLPFFGLVFYFLIFVTSFSLTLAPERKQILGLSLWFQTAVGFIISLYLFFVEVSFIKAICLWCTASGADSLLLFVLTSVSVYNSRKHELGN